MEPKRQKSTIGGTVRRSERLGLVVTAAAALFAAGLPASATAAPLPSDTRWQDVVVTGAGADAAADAVTAAGGRVITALPFVRGVAARLPVGATLGPDWAVAPQRELRVASAPTGDTADPTSTVRATLGLPADGAEGRGATVAVVDTGIAEVPDLAGRVAARFDATGTGAGDGYGHGTFMAGLIAGSGRSSGGAYRGVAPAAALVDVKVADDHGSTDLITVLRGLQWVSEHAGSIDVLNLSLSSYSPLPYQVDPLTQGLEALWRRGVTVVVPSGNDGPDAGTVTAPGNDPVLLTAGGIDESGTAARTDDTVGAWSGRGPTWQGDAKPDLVAPGGHLIGLRVPGSAVDTENPGSRVGADYFRGSGTSMAAAVTSGVAAAVLAEQPNLRPDSIKNLLTGTAYAATGLADRSAAGAGGLDAARALAAAPTWRHTPTANRYARDTAAIVRDVHTWVALERAVLEQDAAGASRAWDSLSPASRDWAARTWADLDPAARTWAARTWAARTWAGAGEEWVARTWAARTWAARTWAADDWTARTWANERWSARTWAWLSAP